MKTAISLLLCILLVWGGLSAFAENTPEPSPALPAIPDLLTVEEALALQEPAPADEATPGEEPWERLPQPERPDFVHQLFAVATKELGYVEGPNNYSKYGEWSGDPNAAWCAEFICWCVNQTDLHHHQQLLNRIYPKYSGQNTGKEWFIARGRFLFRKAVCPDWGPQWLQIPNFASRNQAGAEYSYSDSKVGSNFFIFILLVISSFSFPSGTVSSRKPAPRDPAAPARPTASVLPYPRSWEPSWIP